MKVLSVIVSYNFEPWLDKCLGSLLASSYPTDIMVIDNASQDRTVERIRKQYPQVNLIESKANLGFGKANNIGFDHAIQAAYDFVFLINQDAWVQQECISRLLSQHIPDNVGIISPLHYDGTERALDRGFKHYVSSSNIHLSNTPITFINAAFWLVPIHIIKRLGGFSPLFYHYGEDKDFANRLRYHGYRITVNNQAIAYHDRQSRPTKLVGQKLFRSEFVYLLTEYANINYSGVKAFGYAVLAASKKAFTALGKRDIKAFAAYMGIAVKLLAKSRIVFKTRQENKRIKQVNAVG